MATKSYPRHSSNNGDSCCCSRCLCGCFNCCCKCLCSCIGYFFNYVLSIICNIIIAVVIFAVLFWLIVRPNYIKFTATDTSLTQFNFRNNNTLHYDLSIKIAIRNPNRRVGIYYNNIEMLAFYKDVRFGSQTFGKFFQSHKNTSFLNAVFRGQKVIPLSSDQILELDKETKNGVYAIVVKILLKARFTLGLFKTWEGNPMVRCDLQVPLKSGNEFLATNCDWDDKWWLFR
ncbi:late embryogenesis abundant protein [Trifolium pratense]|uniref:Late embryogenesis abundant protein n=1 Tax=Trifolium pratense TaxID=57577 RepID=A0A2K3M703_TRIPR|nr:late embryogenesis abundant protein [Trifolium pratense]PNX86555.1 late embryogenesis abundant protein [Trifolium pratense]PNX87719.1 late embryogenesis abundant protein [Trifolium pratense]PNX91219.1 late embryogenesis abundant protein [Trifolium pratense]